MRSPWGRVIKSIREDEDAARSLGKNIFTYKMQSLIIGGIIGAFGGMVIAVGNQVAQPNNYSTALTFFAYTILILGGVARVKGPIIGAMIFWFLIAFVDNVLAELTAHYTMPGWIILNDNNFGQVKYILVGVGLVPARRLPAAGHLRGQAGAGVRCPLTSPRRRRSPASRWEPGVAKPDPILVADGIRRNFGGLTAVDVEHVEFQRGRITALIGPNGAGKTTFFNLLTGFDEPDNGRWTFDGEEMNGIAAYKTARLGMVRTFQLTKALTRLSVIENMKLGATDQRGEGVFRAACSSRSGRRRRRRSRPRPTGCSSGSSSAHMRDEFAGNLSGGQRKLLEMARALMADPRLIMLDEPMAGVNPALTQSLLGHVKSLRDEGRTVHLRRARHGRGARHQRLGGGHGRGFDHRRGHRRPRSAPTSRSSTPTSAPTTTWTWRIAAMAETPCIEAVELVAGYVPEVNILNGCNLTLGAGRVRRHHRPERRRQVHAAEGGARAGATIRSGTVTPRRRGHHRHKAYELVARGVGFVPQTRNVFPSLTVRENLEMGCFLQPDALRRPLRVRHRRCSPASASGPTSGPARCRAASARWWPWGGR